MALAASGLLALAIFIGVTSLSLRPRARTAERLAEIVGGAAVGADGPAPTVTERLVWPMADGLFHALGAILPNRLARYVQRRLEAAGEPVPVETYVALQLLCPAASAALVALAVVGGNSTTGMAAAFIGGATLLGAAAPHTWLSGRVQRRQADIARALPDTLDLIVVSVEAGLGLEAAIARITDRAEGPLTDELRRVLADMNIGVGRRRALQALASRTQSPPVGALVAAILQAEQTGMALGQVLRSQSNHQRMLRRQRAEEAAMKAPMKMLFPLVFFIFPSLFVVVLGPAMISLLRTLGGT